MSLPKLSDKVKNVLKAPEKDLRKLLKESPLGAPPKLSAALGKAGKGIEEEIELPVELPELPVKGKKAGGKTKLPELPELPKLFEGKGKAGLSPPELGEKGGFLPELPKLEEILPFKAKEEKKAAPPAGGAAPPAGGGPKAKPTPTPERLKEGILRKEGKVKEGILRQG